MAYHELRSYSLPHDGEVARLSVTDANGQEYFAIVRTAVGKVWRERRSAAFDTIEDAITRGYPPGEVEYGR